MLPSLTRALILLSPFLAIAWGSSARPALRVEPSVSHGLRIAALATPGANSDSLLRAAQEASERSNRATSTVAARASGQACEGFCAALAMGPDAADLSWDTWIDSEMRNRDALALSLYRASLLAAAPRAVERARHLSERSVPVLLRMEAQRTLWRLDPDLAVQQGRLLIREYPRGTTGMHARYVQVLAEANTRASQELLIQVAHRDGLESHPRVLAIQALAATGRIELGADLATIWNSSTGDIATRQQALLATLALDPLLGERMLLESMPLAEAQPVLFAFAQDLRRSRGLPLAAE
jgi:hypothetical protein